MWDDPDDLIDGVVYFEPCFTCIEKNRTTTPTESTYVPRSSKMTPQNPVSKRGFAPVKRDVRHSYRTNRRRT